MTQLHDDQPYGTAAATALLLTEMSFVGFGVSGVWHGALGAFSCLFLFHVFFCDCCEVSCRYVGLHSSMCICPAEMLTALLPCDMHIGVLPAAAAYCCCLLLLPAAAACCCCCCCLLLPAAAAAAACCCCWLQIAGETIKVPVTAMLAVQVAGATHRYT